MFTLTLFSISQDYSYEDTEGCCICLPDNLSMSYSKEKSRKLWLPWEIEVIENQVLKSKHIKISSTHHTYI